MAAPQLQIISFNIACSGRDEAVMPLRDRIEDVAAWIGRLQPDVVVILESGRTSRDMHWEQMARLIETVSGLEYVGCKYANTSANSFAKSFFVRAASVRVVDLRQVWVPQEPGDTRHQTADIVSLDVVPVGMATPISIAGVHVSPLDLESRMRYCRFLASQSYDLIMGDFNTFWDDGGEDMMATLAPSYQELLPSDSITFQAFPHDLISIPRSKLAYHAHSEIISTEGETVLLRPKSWLDHAMISRDAPFQAHAGVAPDFDYVCSDHAPIVTCVTF